MAWFVNLSTRLKLALGLGCMWLLMATVIGASYWETAELVQFENQIYEHSLPILTDLQELRSGINYSRGQLLELTLTSKKPDQAETEAKIRDRSRQITETIERLLRRATDPGHQGKIQEIKAALAELFQTQANAINLVGLGKLEEARQLALGIHDDRYEKIRSTVADILRVEDAFVQEGIKVNALGAQRNIRLFVALGLASFVMGLVMILLFNQAIARPLGAIASLAGRIAAGDLTVQIPGDGRGDEVGVLARGFREMVGNLRGTTAEISEAVNRLGTSASEILAATTQVAAGTAETAAAISQTTTTVEQVRQAAQLSSQKAQDVSAGAKSVAQVSQHGKKAMDELAMGIQGIHREMEAIAKTVVFLSDQGQAIGGIVATVTDLADQSNLLAVNAAIEAAKAGEQGKGFTVVAQEIKSLSEQSKQATGQVRTILTDIQKATSQAVMATEQGGKAVEAGTKQAGQAGQAIMALSESTVEAAQASTQIAVSSQQQVVGMDQVGLAMENINQAGAETAASMKQVEVAVQGLNDLGLDLKRLVQRYNL